MVFVFRDYADATINYNFLLMAVSVVADYEHETISMLSSEEPHEEVLRDTFTSRAVVATKNQDCFLETGVQTMRVTTAFGVG